MKRYMLRFWFFVLPALLLIKIAPAQYNSDFLDNQHKMVFGGSLGLQFGTQTIVDVSPMTAYRITKRLMFGVSPTYKYYSYLPLNYNRRYRSNVLGGGLFSRFYLMDQFYTHFEYEFLHYRSFDGSSIQYNDYKSILLGGGYMERLSGNSYFTISVLWNLNDTYNSIYNNPVIRFGYLF